MDRCSYIYTTLSVRDSPIQVKVGALWRFAVTIGDVDEGLSHSLTRTHHCAVYLEFCRLATLCLKDDRFRDKGGVRG